LESYRLSGSGGAVDRGFDSHLVFGLLKIRLSGVAQLYHKRIPYALLSYLAGIAIRSRATSISDRFHFPSNDQHGDLLVDLRSAIPGSIADEGA
jgi:hypothetical protein